MAAALDFEAPRVNLMTALAGLWGVRRTFNLARKGGYRRGGEDYRWSVMQERLGPGRCDFSCSTSPSSRRGRC